EPSQTGSRRLRATSFPRHKRLGPCRSERTRSGRGAGNTLLTDVAKSARLPKSTVQTNGMLLMDSVADEIGDVQFVGRRSPDVRWIDDMEDGPDWQQRLSHGLTLGVQEQPRHSSVADWLLP